MAAFNSIGAEFFRDSVGAYSIAGLGKAYGI